MLLHETAIMLESGVVMDHNNNLPEDRVAGPRSFCWASVISYRGGRGRGLRLTKRSHGLGLSCSRRR